MYFPKITQQICQSRDEKLYRYKIKTDSKLYELLFQIKKKVLTKYFKSYFIQWFF